MKKNIITIEIEKEIKNNKTESRIIMKVNNEIIFDDKSLSLFNTDYASLIVNIKRILCEIDEYDTFDISKYHNGFRD